MHSKSGSTTSMSILTTPTTQNVCRPFLRSRRGLLESFSRRPYTVSSPALDRKIPARWLEDVKKRLSKCIMFGLSNPQIDVAGGILKDATCDWRQLVGGSEGYLTGPGRAGFEKRDVIWGEMDVMVGSQRFNVVNDLSISVSPFQFLCLAQYYRLISQKPCFMRFWSLAYAQSRYSLYSCVLRSILPWLCTPAFEKH